MALDWGQITPEGVNLNENEFLYVYNHDLSSSEKIDRTIRFIIGRLNYYDNHLPENPRHQIKIDIRGQSINNETCEFIVQTISQNYKKRNLLNIDFVK
ncbi:MAG: hypothetical protein KAZ71_03720 [Bacteroidia bacterium]|nr:hypothetical protein [Bacteroidia bacterium]